MQYAINNLHFRSQNLSNFLETWRKHPICSYHIEVVQISPLFDATPKGNWTTLIIAFKNGFKYKG